MRIKICGLARKEDAAFAEKLGAWALGFIFYPSSPRFIMPSAVAVLKKGLSTPAIGVFVDQMADVLSSAQTAQLQGIQLHGTETPDDCRYIKKNFNGILIKVFRPAMQQDLAAIGAYKDTIDYILLDTAGAQHGGTGKTGNWDLAVQAKDFSIPLILAGGLHTGNIKQAAATVAPAALDLSSRIEDSPGIKNHDKLKTLFETIKGISA